MSHPTAITPAGDAGRAPSVAALLDDAKLKARDAAVRRQYEKAAKAERRTGAFKSVAVVGFAALSGLLGWRVADLAEKVATRPVVYSVLQPNGEWVASDHYDEAAAAAPAGQKEHDVQNALWTYVRARDCYGSEAFLRQVYVAQAMSDDRVARQVRAQFDLRSNPAAPQKVYGEKGIIVHCDLVDPPTPIGDGGDLYLFRFHRLEDETGRVTATDVLRAPVYSVTVRYRTGIYPRGVEDKRRRWLDRVSFNAAGVQVLDYPGAQPQNARPSARITPGADRPAASPAREMRQ